MKRRNFFKNIGLGAAAIAVPTFANAANTMSDFEHDPMDYAVVPEEPEEFQEYEVDIPEDWAEESIIFI